MDDDITHSDGDDCRLAVEVLTRQAKRGTVPSCVIGNRLTSPAIYEVHRGGVPVASLVLPKTTFRLGETVHGVISLNCFEGGLEVLKVCEIVRCCKTFTDEK